MSQADVRDDARAGRRDEADVRDDARAGRRDEADQ